MAHYFVVKITSTGAPLFSSEYRRFDDDSKSFGTVEEARAYIKERYANVKKDKMYRDGPDGKAIEIGWVYHFRNKDYSHNGESWNQQDWVEIREVTESTVEV